MTQPLRLAALTGAIARAADVGIGLPPETALRTCVVAVALARALGLTDEEIRDVYYSALLRHAGCTASAHEETRLAGDELQLRSAIALGDAGSPKDMLPRLLRGVGRGQPVLQRGRTLTAFLARAPAALPTALKGRCEVAVRFAVRLGLGPRVEQALDDAFERWDGKGLPRGRQGREVSLAARLVCLAELGAAYLAVGGVEAARAVVASRSGGHVDPELAACFVGQATALLAGAQQPSLWDSVMDAEPKPLARVGPDLQRAAAELLADFADLKSTWTLGHSRGVAARAGLAAKSMGATDVERALLETASLVHDVGRVAVSNALWDKPGALGHGEMELVRTHAYHTQRIMASVGGVLGEAATLASAAHERVNGSGYHRQLAGSGVTRWARLLAAADVAQALSEPRPHRPAFSNQDAARVLRDLAMQGALCPRAVDAVLVTSGAGGPRARANHPAKLSHREVEVLRLVARGLTDKEVASSLGISHRTVHHHNKHAFDKIGVSTRAAAALFLVENDLLDS